MLKQKTLQGSFSLCGKGLHTGLNLTVTFNPAPENHGYKIQRIDLDGRPIIDAVAEKCGRNHTRHRLGTRRSPLQYSRTCLSCFIRHGSGQLPFASQRP